MGVNPGPTWDMMNWKDKLIFCFVMPFLLFSELAHRVVDKVRANEKAWEQWWK